MTPSKAPWLFKAKKMMEEWKSYKVNAKVSWSNWIIGKSYFCQDFNFSIYKIHKKHVFMTQVIGHYMGNYPAVTIQDFALAKELFNRFQNTPVTLDTITQLRIASTLLKIKI